MILFVHFDLPPFVSKEAKAFGRRWTWPQIMALPLTRCGTAADTPKPGLSLGKWQGPLGKMVSIWRAKWADAPFPTVMFLVTLKATLRPNSAKQSNVY